MHNVNSKWLRLSATYIYMFSKRDYYFKGKEFALLCLEKNLSFELTDKNLSVLYHCMHQKIPLSPVTADMHGVLLPFPYSVKAATWTQYFVFSSRFVTFIPSEWQLVTSKVSSSSEPPTFWSATIYPLTVPLVKLLVGMVFQRTST